MGHLRPKVGKVAVVRHDARASRGNGHPPDEFIPEPHKLVPRNRTPDTIAGWKAVADGLLSDPCCAFHRNVEISSRYAWIYKLQPACFKWAAMAAIASHHIRIALYPLRLDTDGTGYVDIPHSLVRQKLLLTEDVNTIRATNNAIFNDIFWVHLAYVTAEDGIERLRALLQTERHYAPVLAGFETIDQGRRALDDAMASAEARQTAVDLIWEGNIELLEHEQRALVQPNFDRLSCASARLVSIGSASSFEARGVRQEVACFTSFYLYSLTRGIPQALRAQTWPRITRFDDRWRWLVTSVVPQFRRFDANTRLVNASLRHIVDEARDFASTPCVLPRHPQTGPGELHNRDYGTGPARKVNGSATISESDPVSRISALGVLYEAECQTGGTRVGCCTRDATADGSAGREIPSAFCAARAMCSRNPHRLPAIRHRALRATTDSVRRRRRHR